MHSTRQLAGALSLIMAIVGGIPATALGTWTIQSILSPTGATLSGLSDVSCKATTSCMAVGLYETATETLPLSEEWESGSWTLRTVPSPSGSSQTRLEGVSCTSATECTAVGESNSASTPMIAERWRGKVWTLQSLPMPEGGTDANLSGVSCVNFKECFAVGSYLEGEGITGKWKTLAENWNGTAWTVEPTPNPSGSTRSELAGVSCKISPHRECIAVGHYTEAGVQKTLAEHFAGTSWTATSPPNPSGSAELYRVSCLFVSNILECEATGQYQSGANVKTLAERWNGIAWGAIQTTPNGSGAFSTLAGVSCPGAASCISVGSTGSSPTSTSPFAEAYTGTWAALTPAVPVASTSALGGVSCAVETECTAVGSYKDIFGEWLPLAESYT